MPVGRLDALNAHQTRWEVDCEIPVASAIGTATSK